MMTEREKFEAFMFSKEGCELHSKINTSDISANAFAHKIWQARDAEISTLNDAIIEDKIFIARLKEVEQQLAEAQRDAVKWRGVAFSIEQAINNGCCPFDIEDAYDSVTKELG